MKHRISIVAALLLAALLWILPVDGEVRGAALWIIAIIWVAVTVYGSGVIGANWYLDSRNRVKGHSVALTFDDGPDPETTPLILSILKENRVSATFFLIGEKAEKYPGLVRQIADEGHSIGNHSYSHSRQIGFFTATRLKEDLEKCSRKLEEITSKPVQLFRPPFGVTNPRYARVLAALNMISVGWSLRSYDTVIRDKERLLRRLIKKVKPGQIVLLHDTVPETAEVLPFLIAYCRERGIGFEGVSVD